MTVEGIQRYVQQHPLSKADKKDKTVDNKPPAELSEQDKMELVRNILANG